MLISTEWCGLTIECMAETPTLWPSGPDVFLIVKLTTAQTPGISVAPARLIGKVWPAAGSGPHWSRQERKWWKASAPLCTVSASYSLSLKLNFIWFSLVSCAESASCHPYLGHLKSLTEPCPISMANSCELSHFVPGQANWIAQAWEIWYISIDAYVVESSHNRMIKEPIREGVKHVLCRFKKNANNEKPEERWVCSILGCRFLRKQKEKGRTHSPC